MARPAWSSRSSALRQPCAGDCSYCRARSAHWPTLSRRCSRGSETRDQSPAISFGPILAGLRASLPGRSGSTSTTSPAFVTRGSKALESVDQALLGKETPCRPAVIFCAALRSFLPPSCRSRSTIDAALAQTVDLLKLFVPAAPGGGWDQTARTIEQVLRATGAVKGVPMTNVGGAGGAVGLPQFLNQWKGQGNALMVAGMVMVGAIIANKSPVKLAQATPIARLTGEFLALVVPAASPFKNAKDFAAALKAD